MDKRNLKGWLYLLPAILFLGAFMVYPLIDVFIYSFEEGYNSASQTSYGTGLYNYSYVLHDPYFLRALKNTFLLVIITVPLSTGLALVISTALSSIKPLRSLFQTIYFLPYVTNTLAVGLVFMILFKKTPYTDGLVNLVIGWFGKGPVDFIDGPYWAKMFVLCFYTIWIVMPFKILDPYQRSGLCGPDVLQRCPGRRHFPFPDFLQNHAAYDFTYALLPGNHWIYRRFQGIQRCRGSVWHQLKCRRNEHHCGLRLRHALRRQRRLSFLCVCRSHSFVLYCFDHHLHQPAGEPQTRLLFLIQKLLTVKGCIMEKQTDSKNFTKTSAFGECLWKGLHLRSPDYLGRYCPVSFLLDGAHLLKKLRLLQFRAYPRLLYRFSHPGKLCGCFYGCSTWPVSVKHRGFYHHYHCPDDDCHCTGSLCLCQACFSGEKSDVYPVSFPDDDSQ